VRATFDGRDGAGGHLAHFVAFQNIGTSSCVLIGYPGVVASEPGQPDVAARDGSFFPSGSSANMGPGERTLLDLETDTYCAASPDGSGGGPLYHHVRIAPPGGGTVSLDIAEGLDVTCGLRLTTFFVPQRDPAEPLDVPDPVRDPVDAMAITTPTPAETPS
jgi:hypothetical protein